MRTRILHSLCLLVLALLPVPAPLWGQDQPAPQAVFDQWMAGQREAGGTVVELGFTERIYRMIDSASGKREIGVLSSVRYDLPDNAWERTPEGASLNGQRINPERGPYLLRRSGDMLGPDFNRMLQASFLPPRLLRQLVPRGEALAEALDGRPVWRFELAPAEPRLPLQRVTVWFDRQSGALLRSRAILGIRGAIVTSTTDYQRLDGLDLPRQRRTEGTLQTRRRMRTFATVVQLESTYSDFSFRRSSDE